MSITKRGGKFRVRVRRVDGAASGTFATKREAELFKARVLADIAARKLGRVPDRSVGDLLARYVAEVSPTKRSGGAWEARQLAAMVARGDPLLSVRLPALRPDAFAAWRDRRLLVVSGATVNREWNFLSAVCSRACKEWGWLLENPMGRVRRPADGKPRDRRPSADEIERLCMAAGYSESGPLDQVQQRVAAAFLFAIETAMRAGEICALRWDRLDLAARVARQVGTKTEYPRDVPLSAGALAILARLHGRADVFGLSEQRLDANFRKLRDRAAVDGLHFHDSRAEALTRLSRKLNVMQLAKVSGHRDLRQLLNTYYRERAEDLVDLIY